MRRARFFLYLFAILAVLSPLALLTAQTPPQPPPESAEFQPGSVRSLRYSLSPRAATLSALRLSDASHLELKPQSELYLTRRS